MKSLKLQSDCLLNPHFKIFQIPIPHFVLEIRSKSLSKFTGVSLQDPASVCLSSLISCDPPAPSLCSLVGSGALALPRTKHPLGNLSAFAHPTHPVHLLPLLTAHFTGVALSGLSLVVPVLCIHYIMYFSLTSYWPLTPYYHHRCNNMFHFMDSFKVVW